MVNCVQILKKKKQPFVVVGWSMVQRIIGKPYRDKLTNSVICTKSVHRPPDCSLYTSTISLFMYTREIDRVVQPASQVLLYTAEPT